MIIMKKIVTSIVTVLLLFLAGFIYYYIALPAINIHSPGLWFFILIALILILAVLGTIVGTYKAGKIPETKYKKLSQVTSMIGVLTAALTIVFIVGAILSSSMINAKKYQQMLSVDNREFLEDIKQISYKDIPNLDKASAKLLGSRKMGTIMEFVSQFEVADNYTQINYNDKPVRVTPLQYGSFIKWLNNKSKGIPAYIRINMATQDVELVKLEQGMMYTESDHFGRNINRHLRFSYPSYIFDDLNFEIDEEGTPYWIAPVLDYTIGLFGGKTVQKVVLVNAITGESNEYEVGNIPQWVDRVFSAELLIDLYDYHGTLKHGFFNSVFSQRDALVTTDGYNYLVLDDDVWVYTGVTSVGRDESNVGFVLMNQRTAETRFYSIPGAEEYSAMSSAEGKVQHLGYTSTFPLLLNIGNQPTYFIALKDAAGLVKNYAMVNIAQYQIVAIGDTVLATEKTYLDLLKNNGVGSASTIDSLSITGKIKKIAPAVIEGTTHYYIILENSKEIFDVNVSDFVNIITYDVGDNISFSYNREETTNVVFEVK